MRISSSEFYNYNIQTMDSEQSQLSQLEQEASSGKALSTPGDNPLAAAQAVQYSMSVSTLAQYTTNQGSANSSLQLEDQTLMSVTTCLQSINTLVQQAQGGTENNTNLASIATEIQGYRNQLLSYANTTDGQGNYLFSGFNQSTQPFTNLTGGGVQYNGDNGVRQVQVSNSQQVATSDTGSSVFLQVPAIGTDPVAAGAAANTGTGTIASPSITTVGAATNTDSYTITFGGTAAAPTYTVTDNTLGTPPSAPAAYTPGSAISLGTGMTVAISGTPNAGDTFSVTPATSSGNSSMFSTIDSIIAALNQPTINNPTAQATLQNALNAGETQLQNSLTNVTVVNASVGGRQNQLTALGNTTQANSYQTQNNLANLTDVDMPTVLTQFEQLQTSLQAAQESFVKVQGMSLFQYLNN
jgi:flagellar hook-associated protein 3 FlgL